MECVHETKHVINELKLIAKATMHGLWETEALESWEIDPRTGIIRDRVHLRIPPTDDHIRLL